jgi:hypothetical protein
VSQHQKAKVVVRVVIVNAAAAALENKGIFPPI